MPKVYIVTRGHHDFSKAERYGELVFMTEGLISVKQIGVMIRTILEHLRDSTPEDYVMIYGPTMMVSLLCSIFVLRHSVLNILIYNQETERYMLHRVAHLDRDQYNGGSS